MKNRTRKLLTRIGAGFMLGMSLFNFGMIWSRQQTAQLPRRTKNIRQKKQENIDQSTQELASMAERHAQAIISTEQFGQLEQAEIQQESQQQLELEKKPIFSKIMRYIAITVGTVALGVIFSSALFNYPISFDKGVLAFIPGGLARAKISLEAQQPFFQKNETIVLEAYLEAKTQEVEAVKLVLDFDPKLLAFDGLVPEKAIFQKSELERIDEQRGRIYLYFKQGAKDTNFKKRQKIANLKFLARVEPGPRTVSIFQAESQVVAKVAQDSEPRLANLLARVQNASFAVLSERGKQVACGQFAGELTGKDATKEDWAEILAATRLPQNALSWQEVDQETAFICASSSRQLHLLLKRATKPKKAELFWGKQKSSYRLNSSWQEDGQTFHAISFELGTDLSAQEKIADLLLWIDGNLSWPKKGLAQLQLR